MRKRFTLYLIIGFWLFYDFKPFSQSDRSVPLPAAKGTAAADFDLVHISFSVLDKKGHLVTDTRKDEIRIYENEQQQAISDFVLESEAPLAIALLIDTSTSIRDKFKVEQEAAIDFFHTTVRRKVDKALLMSFDSTIDLLQPFSDDPDQLTKAVRRLKTGGGTKMFDAIQEACQQHLKSESGKKKVLILITDGDDNMSFEGLDSVMEVAQRNNVVIFAISTNSSGFFGMASPKNDKTLKRLAEETGGRAFFPAKIEEMAVNFQEISQELRNQYALAYRPTNSKKDGTFRNVKIDTVRKGVRVKYRKGYYAAVE